MACDIETYGTEIACIGFAPSPAIGVCIDYDNAPHTVDAITRLLSSGIPITFHFGTFDTTILEFFYGYHVANYGWDTLIAQHVMWPELPRSLAYLNSVNTREPYYKHERKDEAALQDTKSWSRRVKKEHLMTYNCKDVCTTSENQIVQGKELPEGPPGWRRFFAFEMESLAVATRMSRAGMLVDKDRNKLLKGIMAFQWADYQQGLDQLAGAEINVNSPKQIQALLFDALKLPERKKRETGKRTADEDAIVSLIGVAQAKVNELVRETAAREWRRRLAILKGILIIRGIRKNLSSYITIAFSPDNRLRHIPKVGGTDTGRWSDEKFVDGSGCNTQTLPREPEDIDEQALERVLTLMMEGKFDD